MRKAMARLRAALGSVRAVPHAYKRKALRVVRRAQQAARSISRRLGIKKEGGDTASLGSRSVGLPSDNLVRTCPGQRREEPGVAPGASPPFALAFSGGGFRASLAAAGVLRFAADAGILARVRYVSSVSGGSITHGLFAAHYEELEAAAFSPQKIDEVVVLPLIRQISERSLKWGLIAKVP